MKKRLRQALAMCLCMCLLLTGALAADMTIAEDQALHEQEYRVMTDAAVVGDTAYFRVYTHEGEQIWHWKEGMPAIEKAAGGLLRASDYPTIEEANEAVGEETAKYGLVSIFSDGERLMGLNPLNGLIFQISIADGEATFTDVATAQETFMFYQDYYEERWYWSPSDVAACGGYLYWFSSGSTSEKGVNRQRITRISLTDGSCYDLEVSQVDAICAYKDGTLLILCRADRAVDEAGNPLPSPAFPGNLYSYDPATDKLTWAGSIDASSRITDIVYAPELDAVLYQQDTSIMGIKAMGEAQRYAYTNTTTRGKLSVIGDQLIHSSVNSAIVRDLVEGLTAPDSVQVLCATFNNAARAFGEKYPKVPLEFGVMGESSVSARFREEGDRIADIARLETDVDGFEYEKLLAEGLLMDLSADPGIKAYVDALYPAFRELVTGENGEIWAVPTTAISHTGFFVNRKAMQDIGLTMEDMPTNMLELYEFVTRWDREFAVKYPNYAVIEYTENTRGYLLDMTIDMWVAHCQAQGKEIRFDDPVFRELMAGLEKVETEFTDQSMQMTDPEVSDYKTGLFWINCQLVSNWASYMEEYSDRIFIPLTLTAETPFHAGVDNVQLWVVNRNADDAEYALKFLNENLAMVNDKFAHVLLTTRTEPVESPYYAESLAYELERLEKKKAEFAAETDEVVKVRLHKWIGEQALYINTELKRMEYNVTPSAIENYLKVIEPAMYIHRCNALEDTAAGGALMEQMTERWARGEITTEQLIRELDSRLMMIEKTME